MTDLITPSIVVRYPAQLAMRPREGLPIQFGDPTARLHRIVNSIAAKYNVLASVVDLERQADAMMLDPLDDLRDFVHKIQRGEWGSPVELYNMRYCGERGALCFESVRAVTNAQVEEVVRRLRMLVWLDPSIVANSGERGKDLQPLVDVGNTRAEYEVLVKWCPHWAGMIGGDQYNKVSVRVSEWVTGVRRLAQNVARLGYVDTNGSMSVKDVEHCVFWERTNATPRQDAWTAFSGSTGENVGEEEV